MGEHSSVLFRARDYLHPRFWPMWFTFGLLRLAAMLPHGGALALGRALGRLLMRLARSRLPVIETNLARCFPEKSAAERERIKVRFYHNMGISLIEVAMDHDGVLLDVDSPQALYALTGRTAPA